VVVVASSAIGLSLVFRELVQIYTWLLSAVLVISPMVIGSLYVRASQRLVVASLVTNLLLFVALAVTGVLSPENAYWIVVPGFVLYGAALAYHDKRMRDEHEFWCYALAEVGENMLGVGSRSRGVGV